MSRLKSTRPPKQSSEISAFQSRKQEIVSESQTEDQSKESNRTKQMESLTNTGENNQNTHQATSGRNYFHKPDLAPVKLGWVFDTTESDLVPEESTEDHPSPYQKLTPSKNGVHTPYFVKWNRVTEATKNVRRGHESSTIISKYCPTMPAIVQAQPTGSTSVFNFGANQELFDIYKYISRKEYRDDSTWHSKDAYFQEMFRSLGFAKLATNSSPRQALSTPAASLLFQKSRRNNDRNFSRVIMLDLDETLIRAEPYNYAKKYNQVINVKVGEDQFQNFGVLVRPYTTEFLQIISQDHKVVVYTASVGEYAEKIVAVLDPQRKYIDHVLSREHCSFVGGLFVKNLHIGVHQDISIENIIIVDNYVHSFALHLDQGIPIKPFYGDMNDKELMLLTDLLHQSSNYPRLLDFMRSHLDFISFYEFLESNQTALQL